MNFKETAMLETSEADARVLIERALRSAPRLGHFGMGIYDEKDKLRTIGRQAVDAELAQERDSLRSAVDEVRAAADWISRQERSTRENKNHSSYGYKHKVESWFRKRGHSVYVANGSFIAAAVGLGWNPVAIPDCIANVAFCFDERTVADPDYRAGCFVYFIAAKDAAIKIGQSLDVEKRLEQLRTGNHLELEVLAKIRCADVASAVELERELHSEFARLRLEGEWFRWDDEILAEIRSRLR